MGCGVVASAPVYQPNSNWWAADIDALQAFDTPVRLEDFKRFIRLNSYGSVTRVDEAQWEKLKILIHLKNPALFEDARPEFKDDLDLVFEDAVREAAGKSDAELERAAYGSASRPVRSAVMTTAFHRSPAVAAYVLRRARGRCQLCGGAAPFNRPGGEPFLECHHVDRLADGGMDSPDNCAALCPNCHRRMHILNDPEDRQKLLAAVSAAR